MKLGAVIYDEGEAGRAASMLSAVASELMERGFRLAGAIDSGGGSDPADRCSMIIEDLSSRRRIDISEHRGPLARGCRLDVGALEHAAGLAISALDGGAALLIVNKFGKHEAGGGGYRDVIAHALARDVPVLVAVSRSNADPWREFCGGMGEELRLDLAAIVAWCETAVASMRRGAPV